MSVSLSTSTGVYLYFPIISSAFHGSSNLYKAEHSMWACLEAPRATSRRSTFHLQQHQRRRVTRPYGRMPEDPRIISHKRTSIINTLCASCVHRLRHSGPRSTAATLLELIHVAPLHGERARLMFWFRYPSHSAMAYYSPGQHQHHPTPNAK